MTRGLPVLLLVLAGLPTRADVVHLTDGGRVEGRRTGEGGDELIVTTLWGAQVRVPRARVARVEERVEPESLHESELVADEDGLVPPWGRLPGAPDRQKAPTGVPPDFKLALDERAAGESPLLVERWLLGAGDDPEAEPLHASLGEVELSAGELGYLAWLAETAAAPAMRPGLWEIYARLAPGSAEARLAGLARGAVWETRRTACDLLRARASWSVAGKTLVDLFLLPHQPTQEQACRALEALCAREAPPGDALAHLLADRVQREQGAVRLRAARLLGALAAHGGSAAQALRKAHQAATDPQEQSELLELLARTLPREQAHELVLGVLSDGRPAARAQWPVAIRSLTEVGGLEDLPRLLELMERVFEQGKYPADRSLRAVAHALMDTAPRLAGRDGRFHSPRELIEWTRTAVTTLEQVPALLEGLQRGGAEAQRALAGLALVRTREVTRALREAAVGGDAGTRREAALLLLARRDRRGVSAVLEAYRQGDPETRRALYPGLTNLAGGATLPEEPAALRDWWVTNQPQDLEEGE